MAVNKRNANVVWDTRTDGNQYLPAEHYPYASLAVLMDIRDELQKLNTLLHCVNFTQIPATLRGLRRDIAKLRKAAK